MTPDVFVEQDGRGVRGLRSTTTACRACASATATAGCSPTRGRRAEAKTYIREKLSAAQWLIRSIHQRQSTLFKVTNSIVRFQSEFLDYGVKALRPLVLKDVANDIGMHESTVSRATANKYVHTPQGTLELKYFFTSSIRSTDGEGVSAESVKEKIKGIIESRTRAGLQRSAHRAGARFRAHRDCAPNGGQVSRDHGDLAVFATEADGVKKKDVPITVTFRHMATTDALQAYAEKKLKPVAKLLPGAVDAHVILTANAHQAPAIGARSSCTARTPS